MNIIKTYKAGNEIIEIEQAANGRYFVNYDLCDSHKSPSFAGPFKTFAEAETMIKKHRPKAMRYYL